MKFFFAVVITALLSFIAGLQFQWWIIAVIAFLVAIIVHQKAWKAFLSGFLALFLLWSVLSWWIDVKNESLLSSKIGEMLGVGNNPFLMIMITGIIGGLVAGFAAMSGSFLRSAKK